MNSRTAQVFASLFPEGTDIAAKLNWTPRMVSRIMDDDKHLRPWQMRYLIDRYKVNPLFIYDGRDEIILKEIGS